MQSKQKIVSIVGRDGGRGGKEETAVVEIDTTFARTLGITEYQKVGESSMPEVLPLTVGKGWNTSPFRTPFSAYCQHRTLDPC